MEIGSRYKSEDITEFTVWAPLIRELKLKLVHPVDRLISMAPIERGYWRIATEEASPDTLYFYEPDASRDRPDPASHFQPEGVHGPSQVINHEAFVWTDRDWLGPDLADMVIYEIHIGTFSAEGTFSAVTPRIEALKDLGVNALEIMPVAQFPGNRNWGYDGSYVFAVQNSYGGPDGLKNLINECHKAGLAVILDVVYNHFGPEGTYAQEYGPYFTNKYKTDWGDAMNFDEAYSDEVRNFFIENALYWYETYHIDALRIDAVHGIFDASARPLLQQLAETVQEFSCFPLLYHCSLWERNTAKKLLSCISSATMMRALAR